MLVLKGLLCVYFTSETIGKVPQPLKSNYSVHQMLWMEEEINNSANYIHHTRNGGEQQIIIDWSEDFGG